MKVTPEILKQAGACRILQATKDTFAWLEGKVQNRHFLIQKGTLVGGVPYDGKGVIRVILFNGCEVMQVGVNSLIDFMEISASFERR
jgi:hypothetical protein